MSKDNLVKKILDFLSSSKPELIDEIKNIKLEATQLQATEIKTKEGISLFVGIAEGGKLDLGLQAFTDAAGTTPIADGSYTLEDGTIVSVTGGLISEISTPAEESQDATEMQKLATQLSSQRTELENNFKVQLAAIKVEQKNELDKLKKDLEVLVKFSKEIANIPVEENIKVELSDEEFKKLSPLEQYKLNRKK